MKFKVATLNNENGSNKRKTALIWWKLNESCCLDLFRIIKHSGTCGLCVLLKVKSYFCRVWVSVSQNSLSCVVTSVNESTVDKCLLL